MHAASPSGMTQAERRAGMALALIFALRMLGLFLILPVFSVYASTLPGGDQHTLVGLAIGAYGLTQACLQIPFGMAADRWGRKPVITFGLILFLCGSVVAALATDMTWLIVGRLLQGAGAISAAVTALAADLTREAHRTKVMAMIGSSIGLVFAFSMVLAPWLFALIGMSGIFWLTGVLSIVAIIALYVVVPPAPVLPPVQPKQFKAVLQNGALMRLNLGVFCLHLIQTTMWVLVPASLIRAGGLPVAAHWKVYLPAVLISFVIMVPAVIAAERKEKLKPVFNAAIFLLVLVQMGLYGFGGSLAGLSVCLILFFVAFNILEATQPSWISRIAPANARATAMGVYNTLQSLGLFLGGSLGGFLAQHGGEPSVHLTCACLALVWFWVAFKMAAPAPRVRSTMTPASF